MAKIDYEINSKGLYQMLPILTCEY